MVFYSGKYSSSVGLGAGECIMSMSVLLGVYRSLQGLGGLLLCVRVSQCVSACVVVAASLPEAPPEALDNHGRMTLALLQVRLHLV